MKIDWKPDRTPGCIKSSPDHACAGWDGLNVLNDVGRGQRICNKACGLTQIEREDSRVLPFDRHIPVTLLHHQSVEPDGSHPLYLHTYGAYGHSIDVGFSGKALSLVDRGVIYAIAHVRGGGEKGKVWHLNGKHKNKMNSFYDFVDVTLGLIQHGYGRAGDICVEAHSAGGLTIATAINLRPDLYAGAITTTPFVDVVSTMSDADIPLTPSEWKEWGNPILDKDDFKLMSSYSPYDNIQPGKNYPAIFATAALSDYRVTYWEPAKWIAKLREVATGGPFLLKTDLTGGHFGSSSRAEATHQLAIQIAFSLHLYTNAGYDVSLLTPHNKRDSHAQFGVPAPQIYPP